MSSNVEPGGLYGSLPCNKAGIGCCRQHGHGQAPLRIRQVSPTNVSNADTSPNRREHLSTFHTGRSNLELLPAEIQLIIVELLDPVSIACLALCSKTIRRLVGTSAWGRLNQQSECKERVRLLRLLQKDFSDEYLFCCFHNQLRRRQLLVSSPCCIDIWKRGAQVGKRRHAKAYEYRTAIYHLSLLHVHLVLHHGLCLKTLECAGEWIRPYESNHTWRSRDFPFSPFLTSDFIAGSGRKMTLAHEVSSLRSLDKTELLLETKYIFGRKGDYDLREAIIDLEVPICYHVRIGQPNRNRSSLWSRMRSDLQPKYVTIPVHNAKWIGPLQRCSLCPTEFMMMRKNAERPYYYNLHSSHDTLIEIRVWQNFGSGSTPDDPKWSRLVGWIPSDDKSTDGPPSDVKRAFTQALQPQSRPGSGRIFTS